MLTEQQFIQKHANSPKYQGLTSAQKKARYQSYVASVQAGTGPKPKYSKKNTSTSALLGRLGGQSAGKSAARNAASSMGFKLNPKTHDFLTARTNPWCPRLSQVGYPGPAGGGSVKWRGVARGTLQTNAAGFGYIMVSPSLSAFLDQNSISYSTSAYTGASDAFPGTFSPVGAAFAALQEGPYNLAALNVAPQNASTFLRVNAMGIKIRSDVALLDKGGSIKTLVSPLISSDIFTVTGTQIITTYKRWSKWFQANVADSPWYSALFSPAYPLMPGAVNDVFQQEGGAFALASISTNDSVSMGILISGAPNATFDFDVTGWFELFGSAIIGVSFATPTYADPIGQQVVASLSEQNPLNSIPQTTSGAASASSVMSSIMSSAKTILGDFDPMEYIGSLLGGNTSNTANTAAPSAAPELEGYMSDSGNSNSTSLVSRIVSFAGSDAGQSLISSIGSLFA